MNIQSGLVWKLLFWWRFRFFPIFRSLMGSFGRQCMLGISVDTALDGWLRQVKERIDVYSHRVLLYTQRFWNIYVRSNHTQTGDHKFVVNEGEDAMMPCTLKKISLNDTVLWRRASTNEVLTAGSSRVTVDKRINILHDERKYTHCLHPFISHQYNLLSIYTADVLHAFFIFIVLTVGPSDERRKCERWTVNFSLLMLLR